MNQECEKAFERWYQDHGSVGYGPMERHPFEAAWNHQQSKITSLQSDNQKLREALGEIQIKLNTIAGHRMMQIANPARQVINIAKAALAETKQEEK